MVMLMLTLLGQRHHLCQRPQQCPAGAVHLMLFFGYVMLMFWS